MSTLCHLCLASPATHSATGYGFSVCSNCWVRAASGWDTQFDDTIFAALAKAGLLIPDRNERGRMPRCYSPPSDFSL